MLRNLLIKFRAWEILRRVRRASEAEAAFTAAYVQRQLGSYTPPPIKFDGSRHYDSALAQKIKQVKTGENR